MRGHLSSIPLLKLTGHQDCQCTKMTWDLCAVIPCILSVNGDVLISIPEGHLMKQRLNYFAYGSNLHPLRLQSRIGVCQIQTVARLERSRLCFHKVGLDASGKCDIVLAADFDTAVWGAVYQISPEQKILLDEYESLGKGYQILNTEVVSTDNQCLPVYTYQAMPDFIDPQLQPFDWYHELVLQGVSYHEFPSEYREIIQAVEMIKDPDQERTARHQTLLSELQKSLRGKQAD